MDEDVTKLTDEELQARIDGEQPQETAEEVAETPDTETSQEEASEEKSEEEQPEPEQVEEPEPQETEPQKEEPEATQPEEEQKPPSRRETLRIQQILAKREAAAPQPLQPNKDALDYGQALDADPEVIRQLEADRQAEGQRQYSAGLEQAQAIEWRTSLKIDAPTVEKKFPILDKNSPEFHPAVADAVNTWYLNMSGYDTETGRVSNPNVSYADFVEGYMELVQETAGQKAVKTTQNIVKQVAQTGLRPDGSTATSLNLNKAPESMTNEELEAVIKKAGLATQKY